jgi:uncharacterized membrane protein
MERIKNRLSKGTSLYGSACLAWYEHRGMVLAFLALLSLGLMVAIPLAPAHAIVVNTPLSDALDGLIDGAIDSINESFRDFFFSTDMLLSDFSALFGANNSGYIILRTVVQSTVTPVSYVILGIVYLVQTAKIASKFDANGTMPAVKEVIFLFIYFVIFKVLIDNSLDFCVAVFDMGNDIIIGIRDASGAVQPSQTVADYFDDLPVLGVFLRLIRIAILYLTCEIVKIVAYFSVFARSLQIYIYSAFAPIPLALLGLDETRQYGTGFIKNYVAVVFAGAIMVFIVLMFPTIIYFASQAPGGKEVAIIGACLLFGTSLLKAGQWARDILGG